ncbi:hypothetical protein AMTR_s00030p00112980 [Amborella trichopoda]|uniref:Alcohol dehydrogenase-like C-terminal domain-containing protein n=1 Tax=Amborella trichopoda TaxID=13333 RepID=U5D6T2_AMBTC|nr:hypothetical protein AMTR_s00030p00112980 [Amborella trichopoda]
MVGDKVGVGGTVGSCQKYELCEQSLENLCSEVIFSPKGIYYDGTRTHGVFSDKVVVHNRYVVRFPENLPLDASAPLVCAGIAVYSPMKYYGLEPGKHLGVVGLGGLGHLAVKIAKALGLNVSAISTSSSKKKEALDWRLGADRFLVSSDPQQMKAATGTMEYIMDTVSCGHPLEPLLALLKPNGKFILLGGKVIGGSVLGGMKEKQEMIDFCAKHNITADIEVIQRDYLNTAMKRLAEGDVKYRFVVDVANSLFG